MDIVRRNLFLVTIGTERVNREEGLLTFFPWKGGGGLLEGGGLFEEGGLIEDLQ